MTVSEAAGEKNLHDLQPRFITQPYHNSIPLELLPRFDPVYVEHYNKYNVGRLHTHEVPIEDYRRNPAKYVISYGRARGPDIFRITEQKCPVKGGEITVRIFEPAPILDEQGNPQKRAAYINFHGGGWVFGDLSGDHDFCKRIVDGLEGHLVAFDVDYRLAPEHKYPVAVEDAWAAFNWIRTEKAQEFHIDPDRMAVGGVSAGGHLSAVLAHLCRDANIPLRLQLLTVPACDLHSMFTPDGRFDRENCPYDSYREMEFTTALPVARMEYFHRQFLGNPRPGRSDEDWKISPMLAPNFENLAPALVFTAEMDPLRDEGEVYAAKLEAAGVRVDMTRMAGAPHIFPMLDGILESGRLYNGKVIATLRKELAA
ncbi:alpha/beta hydrolase [Aspergillus clavatus NRRL 1]|uniref:Esterase, putative n=1 Tax=Aspergillus clavatus (strain ATCC 1007 / CBS 513.65 / DSM 816 / NCTC 3887 / NRRL 1 / QM 1276 / 107) TaxID=344612 RepID=A1CMS0_ASPCL|nr:esterase, putative [Aspergillus clavatus NRRL 1]EAW08857.1 esterase, putative [Aspergillus clavatus NRRL 1]